MFYKCLNCGHIFEEGEEKCIKEMHGFANGNGEEFFVCPSCGGDFEETVQCSICGSHFLDGELTNGVCDTCINEYRFDPEFCYKISVGESKKVEINTFLASVLDVGDINQILFEYVKKNKEKIDCMPFIDDDRYYFAESIIAEGGDKK